MSKNLIGQISCQKFYNFLTLWRSCVKTDHYTPYNVIWNMIWNANNTRSPRKINDTKWSMKLLIISMVKSYCIWNFFCALRITRNFLWVYMVFEWVRLKTIGIKKSIFFSKRTKLLLWKHMRKSWSMPCTHKGDIF